MFIIILWWKFKLIGEINVNFFKPKLKWSRRGTLARVQSELTKFRVARNGFFATKREENRSSSSKQVPPPPSSAFVELSKFVPAESRSSLCHDEIRHSAPDSYSTKVTARVLIHPREIRAPVVSPLSRYSTIPKRSIPLRRDIYQRYNRRGNFLLDKLLFRNYANFTRTVNFILEEFMLVSRERRARRSTNLVFRNGQRKCKNSESVRIIVIRTSMLNLLIWVCGEKLHNSILVSFNFVGNFL